MSSFKGRILDEIERREALREVRSPKKDDKKKILESFEKTLNENLRHCKEYVGHRVELETLHLSDSENFENLAKELGFEVMKVPQIGYFLCVGSSNTCTLVGKMLQQYKKELSKASKVCRARLKEECNKIRTSIYKKRFEDGKEDGAIVIYVKSFYRIKTEYENIVIRDTFASLGIEFVGQQTDGEWKFKIIP